MELLENSDDCGGCGSHGQLAPASSLRTGRGGIVSLADSEVRVTRKKWAKGPLWSCKKPTQSPWLKSVHSVQENHWTLIRDLFMLSLHSVFTSSPIPFLGEIRVRKWGAENQGRWAKAYIYTGIPCSYFRYSKTLGKPKYISDSENKGCYLHWTAE